MEGIVASFNSIKGWGFVTTAEGEDAFFIRDDCPAGRSFQASKGEQVHYDSIEVRPDGKKRAKGVRLVNEGAALGGCGAFDIAGAALGGCGAFDIAGGQTAVVASFNGLKGWGFITLATGEDAFFIRDDCPGGRNFHAKQGDVVSYVSVEVRDGGKKRAVGVRLLSGAESGGSLDAEGQLNGNQATVSSFNTATGWGFITTPEGDDAFFVRDECSLGRAFMAQRGDLVTFDSVEVKPDGKKRARGVRLLVAHSLAGGLAPGQLGSGMLQGTVVSFNGSKGWGFVTTDSGEDAFFIRDETKEGRGFEVRPGEVVAYDVVEVREDGKKRAKGVQRLVPQTPNFGFQQQGFAQTGTGGRCGGFAGVPRSNTQVVGPTFGVIASFNNEKGWGFVSIGSGEDAFFNRDESPEGRAFQAQKGDRVLFEAVETRPDGKKRARGVRLAGLQGGGGGGGGFRVPAGPSTMQAGAQAQRRFGGVAGVGGACGGGPIFPFGAKPGFQVGRPGLMGFGAPALKRPRLAQ